MIKHIGLLKLAGAALAILSLSWSALAAGSACDASKSKDLIVLISSGLADLPDPARHPEAKDSDEAISKITGLQAKLEPFVGKEFLPCVADSASLTSRLLKLSAVFCQLDPSGTGLEYLVPLSRSKHFKPALKKLSRPESSCIEEDVKGKIHAAKHGNG